MAPKDPENGPDIGPAPGTAPGTSSGTSSGTGKPATGDGAVIEDNVDRELFRKFEKLRRLRIEHRDLDDVISRLALDMHIDEIQMKRLKKRKLLLKDQIERFESQMIPDLNA